MEKNVTKTDSETLTAMLSEIQALNRRDRLRTIGGFFRGLLAMIPTAIFLYGLWYFSVNQDSVVKYIMDRAAVSASEFTTKANQQLMQEFQKVRK